MANQDFKPVADGYRTRWAQAGDEDFEGEVATQQQYLFQEEIKEAFGKRFKVRDVDRVSACKCLCALASHDSATELEKRGRYIGSLDLFRALSRYVKSGPDALQYWSGLLMLQLMHQNITTCTVFLDCDGISTVAEMMARGDSTLASLERRENPFDEYAAYFEKPCSQHVLYVCLMIASNLSNFLPESHELIRATQKPWSFRKQGRDKTEKPPPGMLTVCTNVIRRGRTLEFPTFDAAIRLVHALSGVSHNILPLMRADLTRAMAKHFDAETSEGPACRATAINVQNFAANMVQKHVRGHFGRNAVTNAKANRLAKFYSTFKKKTYFRGLTRFVQESKKVKDFFRGLFDKREKNGVKGSFRRWVRYTKWFKTIEAEAHQYFTWESSRNLLFGEWMAFMENEVTELQAKVEAKCKRVLVLITGEVFKNCIKEWKLLVNKTKIIKRRWLMGAQDTAMRKWKKFVAGIRKQFDDAGDKLRFLRAHMTGDFMAVAFVEWKMVLHKKKTAIRRFVHRTLFFGWDGWIDHMEETREVLRQVNIKCAHVVSLISGDLFHFSYHEWHKFAQRKICTRRVTAEYKARLTLMKWVIWCRQVSDTCRLQKRVREKCGGVIYLMTHGGAVKCFEIWRDRVVKRKRALYMFTHSCLVRCWDAWVHEFLKQARIIRRARTRMTNYLEHYFLRLWAHNVAELGRQRDTIDRIAFRMKNRGLVMCFTQWMHWTSETIYTRQVVTRIRRTYELRIVRGPLQKWHNDARHTARLKLLVYRIKNRTVKLGFEEMVRMVEESMLKLKDSLLGKSALISRWLKRPMINCWCAWSEYSKEQSRRDKLLKRLRFRMLNAGAVAAMAEWKTMVRLQKEERQQLLYFAVTDAIKTGDADELRATLSSHAVWNLRYDRALMQEAMQLLLSRELAVLTHTSKKARSHVWNHATSKRGVMGDTRRHRLPRTMVQALHPQWLGSSNERISSNLYDSIRFYDAKSLHQKADCAASATSTAEDMGQTMTGTSIHALLHLADHVDSAVRRNALSKLREHMQIWRLPSRVRSRDDGVFLSPVDSRSVEMVMEDMPHSDDIIAVVTQRLQGDSDIAVRQEAKALLSQFAAEPAQSVNEIDRRMLDKRYSWQRMNMPRSFLRNVHRVRGQDDRVAEVGWRSFARQKLQPLDVSTDESDLTGPDLNHAGAQRSGDGVAALVVAESARQVALVAKESHGNRSEVDEAETGPSLLYQREASTLPVARQAMPSRNEAEQSRREDRSKRRPNSTDGDARAKDRVFGGALRREGQRNGKDYAWTFADYEVTQSQVIRKPCLRVIANLRL